MVILIDKATPSLFSKFPREVGNPKRYLVNSKDEFMSLVKRWLPFFNLYATVYSFQVVEKVFNRYRPNYNTAIVDKVFLDFDGDTAYDSMLTTHEFLEQKKIYHLITFSGGGFHIYVFTKPLISESGEMKRIYLSAFVNYLTHKLDIKVDPMVVGDLSQMARIPNTYNFKRKRWCIPINSKMINSLSFIKELAKKQQFDKFEIFGSKYVDLSSIPKRYYQVVFNVGSSQPSYISSKEIEEILSSIDWKKELKLDIPLPPLIKKLIAKHKAGWDKSMGYWDRYILILWLRENGLTLKQTIQLLKTILTPGEFKHSVLEEKQPFYIYKRRTGPNALFFPSPQWLRERGYELTKEDIEAINSLYTFESIQVVE